ncbi:MAG: hypothetical protein ABWY57_06975 [Mycetocola sp.]
MDGGSPALWGEGERLLQLANEQGTGDCLDRELTAALNRLVEFHRKHPGIKRIKTETSPGTACEQTLDRLAPEDAKGGLLSVDPCGGEKVFLWGRIADNARVKVNGQWADMIKRAENQHLIVVPPLPATADGPPSVQPTIPSLTVSVFTSTGEPVPDPQSVPYSAASCPPAAVIEPFVPPTSTPPVDPPAVVDPPVTIDPPEPSNPAEPSPTP